MAFEMFLIKTGYLDRYYSNNDDETYSVDENGHKFRRELPNMAYIIFNHLKWKSPVISLPMEEGKCYEVFKEEIKDVSYYQDYLMFIIKHEGEEQLVRLVIELKCSDAIDLFLRIWKKMIPVNLKPKMRTPSQMLEHWKLLSMGQAFSGMKVSKVKKIIKIPKISRCGPLQQWTSLMEERNQMLLNFMMNNQSEPEERNHSVLFVLFSRFVVENFGKSKKELKDILRRVTNMPQFLKQHAPEFSEEDLYEAYVLYAMERKCPAEGCEGFSLIKCQSCQVDRYCNTECQEKDAERHMCEDKRDEQVERRRLGVEVSLAVEALLKERNPWKKDSLSFQSFLSLVLSKIFSASFYLFNDTAFDGNPFNIKVEKRHLTPLLKFEPTPNKVILEQIKIFHGDQKTVTRSRGR